MNDHLPAFTDTWILSKRTSKNAVNANRPYAWMVEKERSSKGHIEETGIVFLTNRECPFHCLMCDLWRNTTDHTVPAGSIPVQIEFALNQMPAVKHLKLYNSGSFFDIRAIPEQDYERIADLVRDFDTVIVESHPAFIGDRTIRFQDMLHPRLEVAIGLESVHPYIVQTLNKKMTLQEFSNAVAYLNMHQISSRAFVLLRPPFLTEEEGVEWAKKSIDFAFDCGVSCCVVIPVRAGNGAMEFLKEKGFFSFPDIESLEKVLEYGISINRGRVFADTWDLGLFSECKDCLPHRTDRLVQMNLQQKLIKRVMCSCHHKY